MSDLAEDRVYDERAGRQLVFAGTGMGVAVVETSGDTIGRFRLVEDCEARDLAGAGGWVAVATPEDVLACGVADGGADEWVRTGFGPAVAVGFDQGDLLAAAPDGALGRVIDVAADPGDWLMVADVDGEVRALDGPLVGASDGVYRFTPDGIFDVGLADVRDVSAAPPLAATGDGLFRLGNGWLRELDGAVDIVAGTDHPAGDTEAGTDERGLARSHAAAGEVLYEYRENRRSDAGATGDQETGEDIPVGAGEAPPADAIDGAEIEDPAVAARAWREQPVPAAPVVAVAYGERTYAMAADGTFLLDRGDEWAHQAIGLPDPVALATPE